MKTLTEELQELLDIAGIIVLNEMRQQVITNMLVTLNEGTENTKVG